MEISPPFQWKVVRAQLDPAVGSEQAGERPVLIVSTEEINEVLRVVAVLPLTSRRRSRRIYSTEVVLPAGLAGQPRESIVMAQQVRVISKDRIVLEYGLLLDNSIRNQIRHAIKVYLDLLGDHALDGNQE